MKLRNFADENKKNLILDLKKQFKKDKKPLWLDLAKRINKPTRNMHSVNLAKINKYGKENDVVIVAGKILGDGGIEKKITLCSLKISQTALEKINKSASKYIDFNQLMNLKNIKNTRIM